MSRKEKLFERFKSKPKDFTWDELNRLMGYLGYWEISGSGSRVKFVNNEKHIFSLHKPHPGNIVKSYVIDLVLENIKDKL